MAQLRELKNNKLKKQRTLFFIILIFYFSLTFGQIKPCFAYEHSLIFYGGIGTPTPLTDLIHLKDLALTPDGILSLGYSHELLNIKNLVALEAEAQITKHLERWNVFSFAGSFVIRWLQTPWSRFYGGSFGFGNGLSYATEPPDLETKHISKSNRLLYHLSIEFTFNFTQDQKWLALLRLHHRSGIFGLIDGVIGGSDYFSLGIKYRW